MGRTSVALAEQFTDEQLWGELLRTRARGIDPWWIRRREYLERAGRYDLIETEGLRQLEWRAGMLLRRWKP